jgi:hypothetical protein
MYRPVPERIKRWYKSKSNTPNRQFSPSKLKKDMIKRKNNVKTQLKVSHSKTKSIITRRTTDKSEQITRQTKEQLPTKTVVTSSKHGNEQKRSLPKSRPKAQSSITHQEKKYFKTRNDTKQTRAVSGDKNEKMKVKTNSQVSIASKSKDQHKNMLDAPHNQLVISSSTTITTDAFSIDNVSKPQVEREGINYLNMMK